jgi:hypothetical protein
VDWAPRLEIHHGAKPATTPGATKKNTTEPRTAKTFLIPVT